MQFKRPSAYPDTSVSKIIIDRRRAGLSIYPRALYFSLRQKQPTHRDFQHNVLFRLRQRLLDRGFGEAAYVCPLFLDRSAYRFNLHRSGLQHWWRFWRYNPWEIEDLVLDGSSGRIQFDRVPVFAEHITVPPHALVTAAAHRYSFTESGTGLCFHSPKALPDVAMSLATFLEKISIGFLDSKNKLYPSESVKMLHELIEGISDDQVSMSSTVRIEDDDPVGRWLSWGDFLRREYDIEQFALVHWKDEASLF